MKEQSKQVDLISMQQTHQTRTDGKKNNCQWRNEKAHYIYRAQLLNMNIKDKTLTCSHNSKSGKSRWDVTAVQQ